jgi:poly(hydroxyalkanoate) depolymerase family esterase
MITSALQLSLREAMGFLLFGAVFSAAAALRRGVESLVPQLARPSGPRHAPAPIRGALAGRPGMSPPVEVADGCNVAPPAFAESTAYCGTFKCAEGAREYLAYTPNERSPRRPALLLMLHGCTQSASDFARGTRMHHHATAESCVVVYASQSSGGNSHGCWNWFRASDQQRDRGEPAILAALAVEMARCFDCDPGRVYVAGLSAGGTMAITLGQVYPDVFRAVGSHSSVPHACAHDLPSAFSAMRRGAKPRSRMATSLAHPRAVPTIVFHGDHDRTVNVRNAMQVLDDAKGAPAQLGAIEADPGWTDTCATGRVVDGHGYTTTSTRDAGGKVRLERWIVHGGGHAWSGGSAEGTYTDARGPDATAEMLRFFGSVN